MTLHSSGEITKQLRALAALADYSGFTPSTYARWLTTVPEDLTPSSGHHGFLHAWVHVHTEVYTNTNKTKLQGSVEEHPTIMFLRVFIFIHVCVPYCISSCVLYMCRSPQRPANGIRVPRTGVKDSCELPCRC